MLHKAFRFLLIALQRYDKNLTLPNGVVQSAQVKSLYPCTFTAMYEASVTPVLMHYDAHGWCPHKVCDVSAYVRECSGSGEQETCPLALTHRCTQTADACVFRICVWVVWVVVSHPGRSYPRPRHHPVGMVFCRRRQISPL